VITITQHIPLVKHYFFFMAHLIGEILSFFFCHAISVNTQHIYFVKHHNFCQTISVHTQHTRSLLPHFLGWLSLSPEITNGVCGCKTLITNPYPHGSGCIVKLAKALFVIRFSHKLDPISQVPFVGI
jgi:hypothetical protein